MRNRSESRKKRKAYVGEGEVVGGDDDVVPCEDEGDEDSEERKGIVDDGEDEDMSEEEIIAWCSRYKDVKAMEAYIMVEQKERRSQKKFVATLAKAAVLKDNPEAFTSECGRIYKWLWRYQYEMGGRKSSKADKACHVSKFVRKEIESQMRKSSKCVLVGGWKWVMQLRASDGKWIDWIQIQKSNRPGASLGVFAARDFPKGSTIGYVCGSVRCESDEGGRAQCNSGVWNPGEGEEEMESFTFRNGKAKWQTVVAKKVKCEEMGEEALFLGMHYLKSACHGFAVGSKEHDKARKNQNCFLSNDGSVKALKKISPTVEMLLP